MQADFDQMRHALEEAHPGLYRYTSKTQMDRVFTVERAKFKAPLTKLEFLNVLSETVAQIKCGHTKVDGDQDLAAAMRAASTFPLEVLVQQNRLFVLLNDTAKDQTIRPGMEILKINGVTSRELLSRMYRVLPTDGDIESNKRTHVENHFASYYWALFPEVRSFTIEARDETGHAVAATLAGVKEKERHRNQNSVNGGVQEGMSHILWTNDNLSFRWLKDPDIAEIRIDHFVGDDFPGWMEATFKTLRDKGTKNLIVDLRGDGGGKDEYGALLLSYLAEKPFRYFDHIDIETINPSFKGQLVEWSVPFAQQLREDTVANPVGGCLATTRLHEGLAEQSPARERFKGNVFVLTDGGTFSTAADFCAIARHLKLAKFVGEETGGAYMGNNSGLVVQLILQNSRLKLTLPMYEYWNAVLTDPKTRRGTIPEYPATLSAEDFLRGRDEQLNVAESLAAH